MSRQLRFPYRPRWRASPAACRNCRRPGARSRAEPVLGRVLPREQLEPARQAPDQGDRCGLAFRFTLARAASGHSSSAPARPHDLQRYATIWRWRCATKSRTALVLQPSPAIGRRDGSGPAGEERWDAIDWEALGAADAICGASGTIASPAGTHAR